MSHKAGDDIGVGEGIGGGVEKLGVSLGLSRPLAIHVRVSSIVSIAMGGQMSGGGGKVVVVGGDHSTVSVGDQLGVSLGGSLAIHIGVSSIGVVTIALTGKMGGGGGGIGGVKGGDSAISVVHQGISLSRPLAIDIGVSIMIGIGLGGEMSRGGGSICGIIRGHSTIGMVDQLTGGHGH